MNAHRQKNPGPRQLRTVVLALLVLVAAIPVVSATPPKAPAQIQEALSCLITRKSVQQRIHRLDLPPGNSAWVRYYIGTIPGSPATPGDYHIAVYDLSQTTAWLLAAHRDKHGRFVPVGNGYRLQRFSLCWDADKGRGGPTTYKAISLFAGWLMQHRKAYTVKLEACPHACAQRGKQGPGQTAARASQARRRTPSKRDNSISTTSKKKPRGYPRARMLVAASSGVPVSRLPLAPSRVREALGCLMTKGYIRDTIRDLGLELGNSAMVRYYVGSVPGGGATPGEYYVAVYAPDRRTAWLLLTFPDRHGLFVPVANGYRLRKLSLCWQADEGNGGLGTYEILSRFAAWLVDHRQAYRVRLEALPSACSKSP